MKFGKALLSTLLSLFCSMALLAQSPGSVVWQIGEKDGSESEFGLAGRPYSEIAKHFPECIAMYTIGESSLKNIPYVIPGPADSWAGNKQGRILIRFGSTDDKPQAKVRLVMDFVEVHPSAPNLEIVLNDFKTTVKAPSGNNQDYLSDHTTTSKNLSLTLDVPAGHLRKGSNTISICSKSGSWMVLDDIRLMSSEPVSLTKTKGNVTLVSVTSEPALIYGKSKSELLHPLELTFVNWTKKAKQVSWSYDQGKNGGSVNVAPGVSVAKAGIPEGYAGKTVEVSTNIGGETQTESVEIKAPYEWTIYLVQHTHTDIGYTKPQTEILTEHLRYIDYAIEYCKATENNPDDSKFRWTCEASWAVKEWLRIRPKEKVEEFLHFVKNGQIEVTAMFFNMSELSGENDYKTFLEPIKQFHELGIPVVTAMQDDVNGVAWNLADYLPALGVKYLSMGSNGHRANIPFDRPTVYKWESPAGNSLISYRCDHYMTGNGWGIHTGNMNSVKEGVFSYIQNLELKNYPFPIVTVQYQGYSTDNSPPSMHETELIQKWNEHYAWPHLRSATVHEFLEKVEKEYSDKLPVYRAAYPDWWTDGFGSAARESAASRSTQSDMITIEGMLSMASLSGDEYIPELHDEIRRIHENLLFYNEHTFGAAESIWDHTCENSEVQWAEKQAYVWDALKNTQMMYETSIGRLQDGLYRSTNPTITFFNPSGRTRSSVLKVYIDFELVPKDKDFSIVDENGKALKYQPLNQRTEGRYYAIWAEDVPAMGYKTYELIVKDNPAAKPGECAFNEYVYENNFYKATFDATKGGIKSLIDKETGKELLDVNSEWTLGGYIYESLENDRHQMERKVFEKYSRTGLRDVKYTSHTAGNVYNSICYEGKGDGCEDEAGIKVEVRFYNDVKRIEIAYSLRRLPELNPSGIYVAFPFKVDDGKMLFDVPGGVVTAGENQLPRSSNAWNTVQNFASARNSDMQVVVSCDEIPLFMFGELLNNPYREDHHHDNTEMFSWVMNNYWTTNFRASQEGELKWTYALTSSTDATNAFATDFGWENRVPLYARVVPGASKSNDNPRSVSFLSVVPENVIMTSCTPSINEDGAVLVNVRETDGKAAELKINGRDGKPVAFVVANALDESEGESRTSMSLKPYENVFVRIK
jgi:hypothetical protein